MEELNIAATRNTPAVSYQPQDAKFIVSGHSIPENASNFYRPVMEWLIRNGSELPADCTFEFNLPYFNSSSLKALYLLLMEIKKAMQDRKGYRIAWYVEDGDEFMQEAADTFTELTGINIEVCQGGPKA